MAQDEIKLEYDKAAAMATTFKNGARQLEDSSQEMQNIANLLEQEALLGNGGKAFVEAIRGKLTPSMAKLINKFEELEKDVNKAIELMRQADEQGGKQVSSVG